MVLPSSLGAAAQPSPQPPGSYAYGQKTRIAKVSRTLICQHVMNFHLADNNRRLRNFKDDYSQHRSRASSCPITSNVVGIDD